MRKAGVLAGVVLGLAALAILRRRGAPPYATVFAEDGSIFLTDAYAFGADSLFRPYAGYLHLVPRLAALLATALPVHLIDAAFAIGGAVVVAALAVYVYLAAATLIAARWLRVVLGGWLVLGPLVAYEVLASIANLHWVLLCAAGVALLSGVRSRGVGIGGCVVAAAAALSSVLAVLLLPLAGLALWRPQGPFSRRVALAFLGGLGIQVVVVVQEYFTIGPTSTPGATVRALAAAWSQRVAAPLAFGQAPAEYGWRLAGWTSVAIALALIGGCLIAGVRRAATAQRRIIVGAVALSVVLFAVQIYLRGFEVIGAITWVGDLTTANGTRYSLVPTFALLLALLVAIDALWTARKQTKRARTPAIVAVALLGVMGALWLVDLRVVNGGTHGPIWNVELEAAAAMCAVEDAAATARVPIAPQTGELDVWGVVLPCHELAPRG